MSRIVRLTESDLTRIVRRVISEQALTDRNSVMQQSMKLNITASGRESGSNTMFIKRYGQEIDVRCDGTFLTPLNDMNAGDKAALSAWVVAYCKYVPA
jgi:hypothetical protein